MGYLARLSRDTRRLSSLLLLLTHSVTFVFSHNFVLSSRRSTPGRGGGGGGKTARRAGLNERLYCGRNKGERRARKFAQSMPRVAHSGFCRFTLPRHRVAPCANLILHFLIRGKENLRGAPVSLAVSADKLVNLPEFRSRFKRIPRISGGINGSGGCLLEKSKTTAGIPNLGPFNWIPELGYRPQVGNYLQLGNYLSMANSLRKFELEYRIKFGHVQLSRDIMIS